MTRTEDFEQLRPVLSSVASRILGSVVEAEDVVQDAWLRYELSSAEPDSLQAFLTTVVTRASIDVLRSARVRREAFVGSWMPEQPVTDPHQDPERSAELADSVAQASMLLLERLGPLERAVFVLREVFRFSFGEIAVAVQRSESACRQTARRARQHMDAGWPRFKADRAECDHLAQRFLDAFRHGDVDQLKDLLTARSQVGRRGGEGAAQVLLVTSRRRSSATSPRHPWGLDPHGPEAERGRRPAGRRAPAPGRHPRLCGTGTL